MSTDRIKTALHSGLMQKNEARKHDVNNIYDANIHHCHGALRLQTDRRLKDKFITKCTVIAAIV